MKTCLDCNKILKSKTSNRCIVCSNKHRKKSINYCCIKCGNLIGYKTAFYGLGMCQKCCRLESFTIFIHNKQIKTDIELYRFLYKRYIIEHKSTNQIAKEICKDTKTVFYHLKRLKIPIRTKSETSKYSTSSFKKGHDNGYKGKSFEELFGMNVANKMKRSLSISASKKIGKLNPNFNNHKLAGKNNLSYIHGQCKRKYPFKFRQLVPVIRKRDKFHCQICHKSEKTLTKKLCVHHIDYNKEHNFENNLIGLCLECHLQTNFNRDYWYAYCRYLMENR
jgi:hypothetical protein